MDKRILIKYSGQVQLHASNFWAGIPDCPSSSVQPWAKMGCCFKIYLLPEFLSLQGNAIPFGIMGTGGLYYKCFKIIYYDHNDSGQYYNITMEQSILDTNAGKQ